MLHYAHLFVAVQVSDTTGDDSSNAAGSKNIVLHFIDIQVL